MSILAIRGHATRGKEVIELLEMLGGKSYTVYAYKGEDPNRCYCIDKYSNFIASPLVLHDVQIFSLEEFLEKYPYKVGDKVIVSETQKTVTIEHMGWRDDKIVYETCYNDDCVAFYSSEELQPYKEETMEEIKVDIPKGYEFVGVDDDKHQVVFTRIQPQYPKTYWDCAKFINRFAGDKVNGYNYDLILNLQRLLICRNAYWAIAGEQMGLGKPWEQDYNDRCFIIANNNGNIHTYEYHESNNVILAFPTAEMRYAFYENFKDLIEQCKELL